MASLIIYGCGGNVSPRRIEFDGIPTISVDNPLDIALIEYEFK